MFDITQYILSKTNRLKILPEVTPGDHGFSMFTDAGTEVEVSEFIYTLTRMLKPELVLETGTHIGVSSSFIGKALQDNNKGKLHTFEIINVHYQAAQRLWNEVGIQNFIIPHLQSALSYNAQNQLFDFLFLDSEPQLRFDEFIKFWPNVKDGGFILIHDLHPSFGHHGQTYHGIYDWPYGDFRLKLGPFIKNKEVQIMSFPTPRGLTLFQKMSSSFVFSNFIQDKPI